MRIQQKVTSYEKFVSGKSGLIDQAKGRKVVHLSVEPNAGPFKGWFPLPCWILCMLNPFKLI